MNDIEWELEHLWFRAGQVVMVKDQGTEYPAKLVKWIEVEKLEAR